MTNSGLRVTGVDVVDSVVDSVNRGEVPFSEPGFDGLLREVVDRGQLTASKTPSPADAFILCVPTPFSENHEVDLSFLEGAAESIAPHLAPGNLVVIESTSPPGTTRYIADKLVELRPDLSLDGDGPGTISVAHCPETVLPGRIMVEMGENDRIIGGVNQSSTKHAVELYRKFVNADIHETTDRTAEMTKLTENSFRDVNIAFANELSVICDRLNIDVWELIELANHHPRVNILQPGPGVGGHCVAVDPWFIVSAAPQEADIIRTARSVNDAKPRHVIEKTRRSIEEEGADSVALLGLSFKNDIDDLRESPSIEIAEELAKAYPHISFYVSEPNIAELPSSLASLPNVSLNEVSEAITKSEVILLLVNHREFVALDRNLLNGKAVIDTKGIWR